LIKNACQENGRTMIKLHLLIKIFFLNGLIDLKFNCSRSTERYPAYKRKKRQHKQSSKDKANQRQQRCREEKSKDLPNQSG
jgi:hypothetical protein